VLRDVELELPAGLAQVTPRSLDPVRAGSETFVLARLTQPEVRGQVRLKGKVAGETFEQTYPLTVVPSSSAGNAFVPRLFAAKKIAELDRDPSLGAKLLGVELSKRYAVASRHTSLLVLESEAMFKAFGLDRTRLATRFSGEEGATSASADMDGEAARDALEALGADNEQAGFGVGDLSLGSSGHGGAEGKKRASAAGDLDVAAPRPASTSGPMPAPAAPAKAQRAANEIDPGWMPPPPMRRPPPRRMIPMRKVWDRKASFDSANLLAGPAQTRLPALQLELASRPDSRDLTAEALSLFSSSSRLAEAEELATKWSGRDALDPDALLARADLAARRGDRARSLRILSGFADVRPGDASIHQRLFDLYTASGDATLACRHAVTATELAPTAETLARATSCASSQGLGDLAAQLRAGAAAPVREAAERLLAKGLPTSTVNGDVQLSATWQGGQDLDFALIDAKGQRLSWSSGPRKFVPKARDAVSTSTETLGFAGLTSGSYALEVTRAARAAGSTAASPQSGEVVLRLPGGETRRVPFTLTSERAELGSLRVYFTSRLVPMEGW
jgi:hypothetical protein